MILSPAPKLRLVLADGLPTGAGDLSLGASIEAKVNATRAFNQLAMFDAFGKAESSRGRTNR